ncbi:YkvA family protein [Brevibacillus sp. B_LB10_24]|uniref:YkvA family protein n=1 Tax=Brevibacillus sp. B_LB10_24 TaxID=3380645 RepID=UPI0038B85A51
MNENNQHEAKTNPNLPVPRGSHELVPIELPKEHQRFYDKLRAKIEKFIRDRGLGENAAGFILLAPDLFVLLARLLRDKRVPIGAKTLAGVAVAYFISPVDFIPEAIIGPLGLIDDVVLAVFALRSILVDVDVKIVGEHWNGQEDLLEVITRVVKQADELIGKRVRRKIENLLFGKK